MSTSNPLSNNAMPRDLRGSSPTENGAGRTYDVDPAAVERLKRHIATQRTARARPVSTDVTTAAPDPSHPAALYSPEVIAAVKAQEEAGGRRSLAAILTDEVLAVWDRLNEDGMSLKLLGRKEYNGLIELAPNEVSRYLTKYRERLATAELSQPPAAMLETAVAKVASKPAAQTAVPSTSPGRKAVVVKQAVIDEPPTPAPIEAPETAVIEPAPEPVAEAPAADPLPKPEIEPLETAVAPFQVERPENLPTFLDREYRPQRPGPGDALAALAALVNNEQIRVRGSVKLNLEIEFGD